MTPTSSSAAPSLLWSLPGSPTDADVALIVCPYAGGTAQAFANELRWLVPNHDVRYLALPGRTHRMTESPYEDLATLVDDLEWELAMMGKPFIVAGYSIGARIALATAERCTVAGSALIGLLPAMSAVGPYGERRWGTDIESVAKDIRRSHPSGDDLHRAGLLERVAAQTLADLHLFRGAAEPGDGILDVPVCAISARSDRTTSPSAEAWRQVTSGRFRHREIEGDHFAIHTNPAAFRDAMTWALTELRAPSS